MSQTDPLSILQDSLRGAPIIWKGEYPYFIHPISDGIPRMEAEVLRATRDLIVGMVDWSQIDLVVSIEAMGLPLLAAVGEATGKPTVVIRKRSYGMEGEVEVDVPRDTPVQPPTSTISLRVRGFWWWMMSSQLAAL